MKDRIIQTSIQCLQRDGLRFSVDELARTLKISKKTVYKYFASKEELAVAVYEKYYSDANRRVTELLDLRPGGLAYELLTLYYRSYCMVREEIFNKYALNDAVCTLAASGHAHIWARIEAVLPPGDRDIIKSIVDGTFEKISADHCPSPEKVIERLVRLIC